MTQKTAILYKLIPPYTPTMHDVTKEIMPPLEIVHLEPKNGEVYELEELQEAVNGYIEIAGKIRITSEAGKEKSYAIIVNEEGVLRSLPVNFGFWWNHGDASGKHLYYGNVLLVPEELIKWK